MLYHPFFVNIHTVIPEHVLRYAEQLLINSNTTKTKPSTSITEITRNPSVSVGENESPKRTTPTRNALNAQSRNQIPLFKKQPIPSVLKYGDFRQPPKVQTQQFRGSSLPTKV